MFRITATRVEGEDRVEVDISKDDADIYEIGAVAMAVDNIVGKVLERGFDKLLGDVDMDVTGGGDD